MFGTFKFNEKTRLSDAIDGIDSRSYTRTTCDFCRLKKLRCSGEMKSCERCQATSKPCTYSLSSGTGRGKKRVRRHHFSDSATSCFPVETERGDDGGRARQGDDGGNREPSQPPAIRRTEPSNYVPAVPLLQESGDSSATPTVVSAPWPDSGADFSSMLAFADDVDFLGIGDNLDLSEVMLICENGSRLWDTSPLPSQGCLSALCDAAPTHLEEEPKANRDQGGSDSIAASLASSSTCGCLSNVARLFETLVSRTSGSRGQSIDMLLIDLEDGVSGCKKVLVCSECTACSDNPTLVATVGSHLVGLWDTIIHRIMLCQRPSRSDSTAKGSFEQQGETQISQPSPQTFRYGRYAVQSPEMKCHLLNNLVQLHFNNLNELLSYLKISVHQKPGAMEIVEQAVTKAARISWAMRRQVAEPRLSEQFISKKSMITGTGNVQN